MADRRNQLRQFFMGIRLVLLLFALLWPQTPQSHESQPGVVEIEELGGARYKITWKAPTYYFKPHPASLVLPEEWKIVGVPTHRKQINNTVHTYIVSTQGLSIDGKIIRFPGLESTITDVFIRVKRSDASQMTTVARPTKPWGELRDKRPWHITAQEYLLLGFNHILIGVDHLLFVLGLLFIVNGRMILVKTITSFTMAHSITLAIATLGYGQMPLPPLNVTIALSILFLGPEIVKVRRRQTSLTIRFPWIIAFGFGLLHGFGFASGLSTTGMPAAELPWALLWFNLGVEMGQLLFVGIALGLALSFTILELRWPRWVLWVPGYTVGSLGAFWTFQRTAILIGGI